MNPLGGETGTEPEPYRVAGVMIGIVTDVEGDPKDLGRIRVMLPVLGLKSDWARLTSFFAGPDRGGFFRPAIDDEVLVAFEMGNFTKPYVIGALWNGVDKPPVATKQGQTKKVIRTKAGLALSFDDNPDSTQIQISAGKDMSLTIDASAKSIKLISAGALNLETNSGDVSISGTNVSIKATASLSLSGHGEVSLSSKGNTNVKGAMINLNDPAS